MNDGYSERPRNYRDRTDPSAHYERALTEARSQIGALKLQIAALQPAAHAKATVPAWASGVIAIIAALGGVGAFEVLRHKPTDPAPRLDEIVSEVRGLRSDVRDERAARRKAEAENEARWEISSGAICRLNGGRPFARGVDCDAAGEWIKTPLEGVQSWRTTAEWPQREGFR